MPRHHVIIHGHFYQPPREEPWLELVPREPTAAPWHDWNARITAECYAPLVRARVLDPTGRIRRVLNAWSRLSFDVGPTLFRWFDTHAPAVGEAIVAADRDAVRRLGFGNALAMPYHHIILPLASRRDKVTEVRWGIRDFQQRFGRMPEGMWLPETAVDEETLAVLVEEGIRFTVLAPHQVTTIPPNGAPGRWRGAGGEMLAIFVYDGTIAHDVAFGDLLRHAPRWLERIREAPHAVANASRITAIATDGETFGHHHRFGDLALASLIDEIERLEDVALSNFGAALAETPPHTDLEIVAPSSWSCPHGVERWREDCGCRMDPGTNQAWRAPLRAGLEVVAQAIHAVVERDWPADAGDPWAARDRAGPDLAGVATLPAAARQLLEAELHALAMFTSCAWFFDDLARVEPLIVLRHAARAMEFLPAPLHQAIQTALLATLATAQANDPVDGDGATIWWRDVLREADGPARLAAGVAAVRDLAPDALEDLHMATHQCRIEGDLIVTRHRRTDREVHWRTRTDTPGIVAHRVAIGPGAGEAPLHHVASRAFPEPVRELLGVLARPVVFAATLPEEERRALGNGALDPATARVLALQHAWALAERDGLEAAAVVVHGALDLFDLEDEPLSDAIRSEAFTILAAFAPGPERHALAERLQLAFDDPA